MHAETDLVTAAERERITTMVDDLARQYRLADYGRLNYIRGLWERGCAYHHAGMLPAAKEIVEQLFTAGLIKLLFCTETFALGINMPAQTVIIDELEKFNGVDFSYLMTRTYNQIAGRAGRRGMDREGFVYAQVLPEVTDPREVERILSGNNERINSRFIASYSTILNLYSQVGDGVYDIFRRSLRNYRQGHFALTPAYEKEEVQIRNRLAFLKACGFLDGTHLTDKGRLAAAVNGYEIQAAELYSSRTFEECTPPQIAVVMGGLVTEESSRTRRAGGGGAALAVRFSSPAEKVIRELRRREKHFGIATPIPEMDFAYAGALFSWANGCSLNDLLSYGVPEGDIIRVMRMTVQLMRTLREILPDPEIADRMHQALALVNRDVVDAQAELRVG
jgi:superfamily II RNA helicase